MRITYDRAANAAYIYLTDQPLDTGRDTVIVEPPVGVKATIVLDWKHGRLTGIEILDASQTLHQDLLDQADDITND